jgi:hypothetical protein
LFGSLAWEALQQFTCKGAIMSRPVTSILALALAAVGVLFMSSQATTQAPTDHPDVGPNVTVANPAALAAANAQALGVGTPVSFPSTSCQNNTRRARSVSSRLDCLASYLRSWRPPVSEASFQGAAFDTE